MRKSDVVIYTPKSALSSPLKMLGDMGADLIGCRELAWQLASRDLRAQYRQAMLGIAWALILPVANTLTWVFIQSAGIVAIQGTALPYPVYVFTGTVIWAILMDAINAPLRQTDAAKTMLAKINFPREALILSGIYQTLINAALKTVILIAALLFMGITPNHLILFFPLAILGIVLAGTALGMLITPIGMLYTDIGKGLPLLMQFLMFLSPVVFAVPSSGWAREVMLNNPLTPLIVTSRDLITGTFPVDWQACLLVSGLMLLVLIMTWIVYRAAMPILIERMSA